MQIELFKKIAVAGLGLTFLSLILNGIGDVTNAPILLVLAAMLKPIGLSLLGLAIAGFVYRYYVVSKG
jgi:hypothetical protein